MKNDRKKFKLNILTLVVAAVIVFTGSMGVFTFADDSLEDKKSELDDIHQEIDNIDDIISANNRNVTALQKEKADIETRIRDTNIKIDDYQVKIEDTKKQINIKLEELEKKQEEIDIQDAALSARLRAMYKNGNSGMLSVLLNSTSITNLLTNIEMARRIYALDKTLLHKLNTEYEAIYKIKTELSDLKESLLASQAEVIALKDSLVADQEELAEKIASIESSTAELKAQEEALQEHADALVAQIREMQGGEPYSGGRMCWPSEVGTYITSPFGYRYIFGGYSFHTGTDISAWGGSNILAANSGTVIWVGWDPTGYGNYVMIDHGGGVVTLYAHSSKVLVSTGQYVSRGQVIALVGTTGNSTGNHLHFEIRVDGNYQDPLDTTNKYYVVPGVFMF